MSHAADAIRSHQQGELIYTGFDRGVTIKVRQWQQLRWLHFDETHIQACIDLNHPDALTLPYTEAMLLALLIQPKPLSLLNLGCGAASFERFFGQRLPLLSIDSIEPNPLMTELAREYFALPAEHPVQQQSADTYLQHCQQNYDLIFCDIHQGGGHPDCLVDPAFHAHALRCLNPTGVYVLNLLPKDNDQILRWLLVLRQSFATVLLLPVPGKQNVVLFALRQAPPEASVLQNRATDRDHHWNTQLAKLLPQLVHLPTRR